jgi:hypothetical protein
MSHQRRLLTVRGLDEAITKYKSLVDEAQVCKTRLESLVEVVDVRCSGEPAWELYLECVKELAVVNSKILEGRRSLRDMEKMKGLKGEELLAAAIKMGGLVITEWD